MPTILEEYAHNAAAIFRARPHQVFAKILTPNDDSGRHGVLIPNEVYAFFPELLIPDAGRNETVMIQGLDASLQSEKALGWKYYQRYPERRITRLGSDFSSTSLGLRLAIFIKVTCQDGSEAFVFDVKLEDRDRDFHRLAHALFSDTPLTPGAFVQLPTGSSFDQDDALSELLGHYDRISALGWVDTLRNGDTGIGYTFETLVGIKENNDQLADFRGIEIKCKLQKDKGNVIGKTNLFQLGPNWTQKSKSIDRLRAIGIQDATGAFSCYSQVTPIPNNLGLKLVVQPAPLDVDLWRNQQKLGYWTRDRLAKRLEMKHSRAAFIKATSRVHRGAVQYQYKEFVYCEQPDIQRFVEMIERRRIVFEFTMKERPPGRVRNHGYPWRLVDERDLDLLFGLQIRLRG